MEGRGHRYAKPGKTRRVLIENLKERTNSVFKKKQEFFFRITNSLVRGWKRQISFVSSSLLAGKVPKNHSPIPVGIAPAEVKTCTLPASGTE